MSEYSGYQNVSIIHPETGAVAEVPNTALSQYYGSGWTLLATEGAPKREVPEGTPEPMTLTEVADALRARAAELDPPPKRAAEPPGGGPRRQATSAQKTEE